jgi:citrate lyase subunit beta/citryl-CoA lyase
MLDSYLFIPGDKQKYLNKIDILKADYIIIDLEDAVSLQTKDHAIDLVLSITPNNNHFVRIPFFENHYSTEKIIKLIKHFEGRIVIPKLSDKSEINQIKNLVPDVDLKMIILVENPLCLININDILKSFSPQIHAIGFGSHDFCSITGINHESEHLVNYIRQLILYTKAYDVNYVDGVDLNLNDFGQFRKECRFAFEMGSSGKFLIHPKQIEELKNVQYISEVELEELKNVYEKIKNIPDDAIEVYTINGKVYEKPHIKRIKILISKLQKFNN